MAALRLTSRTRTQRLTDRETDRLGRLLESSSARRHIWFPDDTRTAVAVVIKCDAPFDPSVRAKVADVLGDFDETLEPDPTNHRGPGQ